MFLNKTQWQKIQGYEWKENKLTVSCLIKCDRYFWKLRMTLALSRSIHLGGMWSLIRQNSAWLSSTLSSTEQIWSKSCCSHSSQGGHQFNVVHFLTHCNELVMKLMTSMSVRKCQSTKRKHQQYCKKVSLSQSFSFFSLRISHWHLKMIIPLDTRPNFPENVID